MEEKRNKEFQRNKDLENFLQEINEDLFVAEKEQLKKQMKEYPVILVVGALRSGTTLLTQWLANTKQFAYATNVLSRFYETPIIGAKIQRLLFDEKYNFRNEILNFSTKVDYISENGKTKGALAPNEFWYFWRRFFKYENLDIDYMPDDELEKVFDKDIFYKELMGVANVFEKPIVLKAMIANYNIEFLDKILNKVIFIHIKRNPYTNIASILDARKRQYGDINKWYSFRIPEINELLNIHNPIEQIAGQVYYNNMAISKALVNISEERKIEIKYEDFCENPLKVYNDLKEKLKIQGCPISEKYCGELQFGLTRKNVDSNIIESYNKFMKRIGENSLE